MKKGIVITILGLVFASVIGFLCLSKNASDEEY